MLISTYTLRYEYEKGLQFQSEPELKYSIIQSGRYSIHMLLQLSKGRLMISALKSAHSQTSQGFGDRVLCVGKWRRNWSYRDPR